MTEGSAIFSYEKPPLYRYALTRRWAEGADPVVFMLLNPSTADAETDDPTIRRCIGFARAWAYPGVTILNLFAFRATDPKAMKRAADPVGPRNDAFIRDLAHRATVICAWGTNANFRAGRARDVCRILEQTSACTKVLALTKDGHPAHPLYLKSNLSPITWDAPK